MLDDRVSPGLLVAPLVGDVAVALQVGVVVDPPQRGPRLLLVVPHQVGVPGPPLVLVEQDPYSGVASAVP
jgi:hypothetical protein